MYTRLTALLLLLVVCALGACGQTGPLYLPEALPEDVPEEQPEKTPVQPSVDTQIPDSAAQTKPSETVEPSK